MPDPQIIIDYEDIIEDIGAEIQHVWEDLVASQDPSVVELITSIKSLEVADEQFFRQQQQDRTRRRGTVYLIVRFSAGAINYGSSVTPISIYALGVANQVKPVQLLLGTFASYWTTKHMCEGLVENVNGETKQLVDPNMIQVWNTPEVISNFNVVDDDFRNLYRVTGNIVIGRSAVRVGTLTYYYGENYAQSEAISIMSFHDGFHTSFDSQPFGNTYGFAESEANFSTYTFSISTYLLDNQFSADILAIRGFRKRGTGTYTSKFSQNDKMKIKIEFTNGFDNVPVANETDVSDEIIGKEFFAYFKVVDSQIGQELAGIPTLTVTFTR